MKILIVLLLLTTPVLSQENKLGDWNFSETNDKDGLGLFAYTVSDSGAVLGVSCSDLLGGCISFFNPKITCTHLDEYTTITSTNEGVSIVGMECYNDDDTAILTFSIKGAKSMRSNNRMSIAFALDTGEFKAYYFSLDGSKIIIDMVVSRWNEKGKVADYSDGAI